MRKISSWSISSVIKQTYKNWELIFFDNQSIDKSKNIALSLMIKELNISSQNM